MAIKGGVLLLFLAFSAGSFSFSRAQDDRCEKNWEYYDGKCYYRGGIPTNWRDAQADCQSKQANLLTVNDANEQTFVNGILGNQGSWCGLKRDQADGVLKWVNGEQISYINWARNEPKADKDKPTCAKIQATVSHKWKMKSCDTEYRYICEKAASSPSPCSSMPCKNGGTCSDDNNVYQCQCPDRFTGKQCETGIPLDPCSPRPCQNGGYCYNKGDGKYFCQCLAGFTGDNCQKLDCSAYPCRNGGDCVDSADKAICKCPSGFIGNICQGKIPLVTQDPKTAVRMAGDVVTFCCEAKGEPTPNFLWFHNKVVIKNQASKTLRLTSLSTADDGLYNCRATNEYGKAVSSEAKLTVVTGGGADSCDPTPLSKVLTLPAGCTEDSSKSNKVDVGTCSYDECIKRGQGDSGLCGGGNDNTRSCCSPTSYVESRVSCVNGMMFNVEKVSGCACSVCALPDVVVHGRVVDPDENPLKKGVIAVPGDKKRYLTDMDGYFTLPVKEGTNRLVLNIKDPFGNLEETTKAFDLHAAAVSFFTVTLQPTPPAIKFPATQPKKISLGNPAKPSFVDIGIPARAFVAADGTIYEGDITASIGVIDPRTPADMAAAPGDFSWIDDNGEEAMLATAGILRQSFTDSSGNKLNLNKNITIRLDSDKLDIPDGVIINQYYLSKETGRWVTFGVLRTESEEEEQRDVGMPKRQAPRKFFVGDITPNVPYDTINWDYEATASFVRVVAPPGTVVTRIGVSDDGQSYSSYRQETVPASGILCMRSLRDKRAVMQAELNGAPLIPQPSSNFPAAVNPQIVSGSSSSNPFKIQSFRFTSSAAGDAGPVYTKSQSGRCQQHNPNDLAFEFQEANVGEAFHWESPRERDPNSDLFWNVLSPEICFIKALVTGSIPDSVIYVKSTGKAPNQPVLNYGYTAEKAARVGNDGVVCLEYRCNQGRSASAYQTHLQIITLTGKCTITELNSLLRPYSAGQTQCGVAPDGSSNQEQNFCVPTDLQGGDAGLYIGDTGVARSKCLTGDNNYSQGRPRPTTNNPTVSLNCS